MLPIDERGDSLIVLILYPPLKQLRNTNNPSMSNWADLVTAALVHAYERVSACM